MGKKKKIKNVEHLKTETVEEFLARGGEIQKIPTPEERPQEVSVKSTISAPAKIMTLQEGKLFYGDRKTRKKTVKKVDQDAVKKILKDIPDDILKKLPKRVLNEN